MADGTLTSECQNQVVSQHVLEEIASWRSEGCKDIDVLLRLRKRCVPQGYSYTTCIAGKF